MSTHSVEQQHEYEVPGPNLSIHATRRRTKPYACGTNGCFRNSCPHRRRTTRVEPSPWSISSRPPPDSLFPGPSELEPKALPRQIRWPAYSIGPKLMTADFCF